MREAGAACDVDGHDVGGGEINVFVMAGDLENARTIIETVLCRLGLADRSTVSEG